MTRDDASDGEATRRTGPDAEAETRVVENAPPADAETRVLDVDAEAETRVLDAHADAAAAAETRVLDAHAAAAAETRVLDVSAPGTDASEDEDRTQVVDRSAEAPPASAAAETRVLEDLDKTEPPPVAPRRAAGRPEGDAPAVGPVDPARGLVPGTVLFGEYEIVNVLGVGGMGEVYRARHRRLDEHRAIKVMHAELSKKKGASEFFYREAKALLAVRHPAVVHCHDLLSDDEGRVYLIMEMIEGIPLSKKMNEGPLSPDDVAILGARVAHGLAAAHRKGVIHRDVSPDNIVLPNGRVQEAKIIDFGIAKLLEEGEGTILDGFKGKLSYASPEQLGFFGGKIDGRSDFYSLGLVLAAAALGRPMSMGTTVMEAVDARRGFQTLPDGIPVGLRSAIQPLLALDPDDRPKYVDRLFVVPGGPEAFMDPGPAAASAATARSGGEAASRGPAPAVLAVGVAAAVAVVAGAIYLGLAGEDDRSSAPASTASSKTSVEQAVEGAARPGSGPVERAAPSPRAAGEAQALAAAAQAAKQPSEPAPRRLSAQDRIKIIGLLNNAKLALDENRLMSPANDNAYDRYRRVLGLDPNNARAVQGLFEVAARYVSLADRAIDKGDVDQARSYVARARQADAAHPGIESVERRLAR